MNGRRVSVNLSADEYSRLEELCPGGMSASSFFRHLLRQAGPLEDVPSRAMALRLLAESARGGKVAAQVALARELRAGDQDAIRDWILNG